MKLTKRVIKYSILTFLCLFVTALPLIAGTQSYPLAVVEGNSMYPNLQNGDLVYYGRIDSARVPNGTIIVFVQGETGMPLLDGLVKPVVIHRVVGELVQADGTVYYETKGDNNNINDPALVRQDHIFGVVVQNIPKVGLLLLFVKSPQGLIATVGIIAIAYLSFYDAKRKHDKNKEAFLGALAQKTLNGELSEEAFKKFELAVRYSDGIEGNELRDAGSSALVDWLKKGGLDQKWKLRAVECKTCSSNAISIEPDKEEGLVVCSTCGTKRSARRGDLLRRVKEVTKDFDAFLLEAVDQSLSSLGKASKARVYLHLEKVFTIKKQEIPHRVGDLSVALERMFGIGAKYLEILIIKKLHDNTKIDFEWPSTVNAASEVTLAKYVEYARRTFEASVVAEDSKMVMNYA